jgi:hypothetical protein
MSKYNRFVELINCATDKDIGNDNIRNKRVYQICTYLQNSSAIAVKLNLDKVFSKKVKKMTLARANSLGFC